MNNFNLTKNVSPHVLLKSQSNGNDAVYQYFCYFS